MREFSDILKRYYDQEDSQIIVNTKQAGLYIKHHCPLLDLYWSDGSLIFVFDKESSKPLYELWCKRELE